MSKIMNIFKYLYRKLYKRNYTLITYIKLEYVIENFKDTYDPTYNRFGMINSMLNDIIDIKYSYDKDFVYIAEYQNILKIQCQDYIYLEFITNLIEYKQ